MVMGDARIIRCIWVEEKAFGYKHALKVVYSTHPRFTAGSRFDWGFAHIATQEDGYELHIAPMNAKIRS